MPKHLLVVRIPLLSTRGRYTHKVAISNHRLTSFDDQTETFNYKDYSDDSKQKQVTLSGPEFIRRFEQHILALKIHQNKNLRVPC